MTGKIIKGIAGFYYIHDGHDKVYACKAKGVFRNRGIKPVVGDNVEFTVLDETALEGNIDKILPRKNVLIRPASANVDQALVVFAITQPDPNFNLLDRFLIMMLAQDIPVTICFNKTDLENGVKQQEYRSIYEQADIRSCLSARTRNPVWRLCGIICAGRPRSWPVRPVWANRP